jgi:RNA polymerase sigma-70 factor, ECF subfamily
MPTVAVSVESDVNQDISGLLTAWAEGDLEARERLVPLVYAELRRRAAAYLKRERRNHTLEPTALVHETFLRLTGQRQVPGRHRSQFFALAAMMMRRILVDRARARKMAKRSGQWTRVSLAEDVAASSARDVDVIDLDTALIELAAFDERKSRVAELKFFAGMSLQETGDALDLSVATVEREWQAARAWLYKRLTRKVPL